MKIDIKTLIPHRGQALLVDEVISIDRDKQRIISAYTVPTDSWWVAGHFPDNPIMPGVLITEAAAQSCAILAALCGADGTPVLVKYQSRLVKPADPGDKLVIDATVDQTKGPVWRFEFKVINVINGYDEIIAHGKITGVSKKFD